MLPLCTDKRTWKQTQCEKLKEKLSAKEMQAAQRVRQPLRLRSTRQKEVLRTDAMLPGSRKETEDR